MSTPPVDANNSSNTQLQMQGLPEGITLKRLVLAAKEGVDLTPMIALWQMDRQMAFTQRVAVMGARVAAVGALVARVSKNEPISIAGKCVAVAGTGVAVGALLSLREDQKLLRRSLENKPISKL